MLGTCPRVEVRYRRDSDPVVGGMNLDVDRLDEGRLGGSITDPGEFTPWPEDALRSLRVRRGRTSPFQAMAAGNAVFTCDAALISAMDNPAGLPQLYPNDQVRVLIDAGPYGSAVVLTGHVSGFTRRPASSGATEDEVATVSVSDAIADFATSDLPERTPEGFGERPAERIARVLDAHGFTAEQGYPRNLDLGTELLDSTTIAQPAWTELALVEATDHGDLFVARDGTVTYRDRGRANVEGPLIGGDDGYPARITGLRDSLAELRNDVQGARPTSTAQRAVDDGSVGLWGRRSFKRFDLPLTDDPDVQEWCEREVQRRSQADQELEPIVFQPARSPAQWWPFALGLELLQTVYVGTAVEDPTQPGSPYSSAFSVAYGTGRPPISADSSLAATVLGLTITWDPRASWTYELNASTLDALRRTPFRLDDPSDGRLDFATLGGP